MVRRLIPLIFLCQMAVLLAGSGRESLQPARADSPRSTLLAATTKTRGAGPSRIVANVRSGSFRYRLAGRFDPSHGYRICTAILRAPSRYLRHRTVWLEERRGAYGTLTLNGHRCLPDAVWFDDHPPTLQLFEGPPLGGPPGGRVGAEDFLHVALIALTGFGRRGLQTTTARACGRSTCYRATIDFGVLDREPRTRDEDGWTLRPLLRSLGRHRVELRINDQGYVHRLRLVAPGQLHHGQRNVRVRLSFSNFGDEDRVPKVGTHTIAYE